MNFVLRTIRRKPYILQILHAKTAGMRSFILGSITGVLDVSSFTSYSAALSDSVFSFSLFLGVISFPLPLSSRLRTTVFVTNQVLCRVYAVEANAHPQTSAGCAAFFVRNLNIILDSKVIPDAYIFFFILHGRPVICMT